MITHDLLVALYKFLDLNHYYAYESKKDNSVVIELFIFNEPNP